MKRTALILVLLFITSTATGSKDIWQTLFQEKLQEANQGNSSSQFDVGSMYQNGRGVSPDMGKAVEWFEKSAAQNNTKAISRLKLLEANNDRFKKILAQANKGDAESQYKLGKIYTKGVGTSIDYVKANEVFERSANQGYAKAEYKLGLNYYEGTGVTKSRKTAYKWFKAAADQGEPAAQYYLGKMFADGTYVKQSFTTSLDWYTKAADGGFNQARVEMIDVTESMKMEKATKAAKAKELARAETAKKAAKAEKAARAEKTARAEKVAKAAKAKSLARAEAAEKSAKAEKVAKAAKAAELARKKEAEKVAKAAKTKAVAKEKTVADMSWSKQKKAEVKAKKIAKPEKIVAAKKKKPAVRVSKTQSKKGKTVMASANKSEFRIEDLTIASWSCDSKPVSYLPSVINSCRREGKNVICYSDSQTRESGGNKIKFKTKSTVKDFSKDGSFNIFYSNLVIDSKPISSISSVYDDGEVGGEDVSAGSAYKVKTGWGREHTLNCQLKNKNTVSCLKNNTHAIILVSPSKIASGR